MNEKPEDSTVSASDLIRRLVSAVGVSGYSGPDNVHDVVAAELAPFVDRVDRDRLGSVIGVKEGDGDITEPAADRPANRRVMLAAHLDEIGAVVTQVDKGFLRFTEIGGLDDRVLMGQEVVVHAQRDLPGIIGSVPPHFLSQVRDRNKVDQHEMHVDVGLPARQVTKLVNVGDLISFARPPLELLNGVISSKALDNRASVAAMIVCLQQLKVLRHRWDVYAVATADEEWGNYVGAATQSYAIRPDVAIALDVTFADVEEIDVKLNGGPVISLGPGNHPVVRERLVAICRDLELKYQNELLPSGAGTDAHAIEISREGVPTVLISVPSRYMHSPVEVVQPKDVVRTGRLLAHFVASLDETFVSDLIPT